MLRLFESFSQMTRMTLATTREKLVYFYVFGASLTLKILFIFIYVDSIPTFKPIFSILQGYKNTRTILKPNSDLWTHFTRLCFFYQKNESTKITINTWFNGCLGSHNDEERSEMRYVMRIAESSESSNLWTQLALPSGSMSVGVLIHPHPQNKPLFSIHLERAPFWEETVVFGLLFFGRVYREMHLRWYHFLLIKVHINGI